MSPEEVLERMRSVCRQLGLTDVGIAPADSWDDSPVPEGKRPKDVMTSCRSVIVIAAPIQSTVSDTAPSTYYSHLYSMLNGYLDFAAERVALELGIMGYDAVYVPRDGYKGIKGLRRSNDAFFSHMRAAYYAGMGTFGASGLLLTPEHGPRVRLVSVLTSAALPYGEPMEENLCDGCGLCAAECPSGAISMDGPPDTTKCLDCNESLAKEGISPCGACIASCPAGARRSAPPSEKGLASIRSYRL